MAAATRLDHRWHEGLEDADRADEVDLDRATPVLVVIAPQIEIPAMFITTSMQP